MKKEEKKIKAMKYVFVKIGLRLKRNKKIKRSVPGDDEL